MLINIGFVLFGIIIGICVSAVYGSRRNTYTFEHEETGSDNETSLQISDSQTISIQGGSISMVNGRLFVDGKALDIGKNVCNVEIKVSGDAGSINVPAGRVSVKGNVSGGVSTMSGNVECGDVTGYVKTMSGDVTCGKISGGVRTMSGDVK